MSLDDIKASVDTLMTAELVRLFAFAGCQPTVCHACEKEIKVGDKFRLVPHREFAIDELTDEMCCADHGEADLKARDKRVHAAAETRRRNNNTRLGGWVSGYSRPSKEGK